MFWLSDIVGAIHESPGRASNARPYGSSDGKPPCRGVHCTPAWLSLWESCRPGAD